MTAEQERAFVESLAERLLRPTRGVWDAGLAADFFYDALGKLRAVVQAEYAVKELRRELRDLEKKHVDAVKEHKKLLATVQKECPHPLTTYLTGGDGAITCDICGAEVSGKDRPHHG